VPTFDDSIATEAPVEEVWKLLYDPARFPEWWAGIGTTEPGPDGGFTLYPEGYPDFPMPQKLRADSDGRRVTISCLVSDLVFEWHLEPLDGGGGEGGTSVTVHAEIPEREAHRVEGQRAAVSASLRALAALAAATDAPRTPG
jgi:uncharacterized protein YndB with AHSA1/START domain